MVTGWVGLVSGCGGSSVVGRGGCVGGDGVSGPVQNNKRNIGMDFMCHVQSHQIDENP